LAEGRDINAGKIKNMKIDRVTITGADDTVDIKDLVILQNKYPFVEWGILHSTNKIGQPRYPSSAWCVKAINAGINASAHLCGWYSRQVLEKEHYNMILEFGVDFKRIQLNYSFGKVPVNLIKFTDFMKFDRRNVSIILQANKNNNAHIQQMIADVFVPKEIHYLYDSSGGRGTEIKIIDRPFKNYTGYSGGINPENVEYVCQRIRDKAFPDTVWIDMESGVRTDNVFDLAKAEKVLSITQNYIYEKVQS
jgi:hypothetical protein